MRPKLNKFLSKVLIGSSLISGLIGCDLEKKIILDKNQTGKIAIFNRDIMDNLLDNSFVEPNQILGYESTNNRIKSSEIEKINNYLKTIFVEKTNTEVEIYRAEDNNFTFSYRSYRRNDLTEKERKRIPNYEEFFREDTKNTCIYFIYPPESKLEIVSQDLEVLNNKTELTRKINTKEYEETEFYNTISKVSDFLDLYEIIKPNLKESQEIEESSINNLGYDPDAENLPNLEKIIFSQLPEDNPQVKLVKKIPGKTGNIIKGAIFLSKALMNETEKQNKANIWKKGISKDWNVQQMPLFIGEEINLFQDNITLRETSFKMNGKYNHFYLMISSLPYVTGMARTWTTGIEDVLIEVRK